MKGNVMDKVQMLSTVDNPYNPFRDFDEWQAWDVSAGYNTLSYLARIAVLGDNLSDADVEQAIDDAIREIVEENIYGVHIAVTADDVAPRPVTVYTRT